MKTSVVTWFMVIAAIVALPGTGYAQDTAVSGTVVDSTGGVLPGATIAAVHEASGNTFEGVTDGRGAFRLLVRPGTYRITAELAGFGKVTRAALELLLGQTAVLDLQLSLSNVQELVTVTAEAPLVDTSKSSLGSNIDPRQMQDLPVNGRNWMDLTMLAAGSRVNAVNEVPTTTSSSTVGFQLNVDGQQVTNIVATGFGQPRYSRDAIGEFEFISNRFDASQGRSNGVQVNAITKSGANTPAGSLSGYFRDDKFNAADHVVGRVLPYSDQQLSTTFGGPIRKDRAHFFVAYEYEREPQTFSYTTPYPRFNGSVTGTRREDKTLARLDFQFSSRTRLSVRATRYDNRIPYDSRYTGGSAITLSSSQGTNRRSEQVFATLTRVIGDRAVNEAKVGHDAFHWNQFPYVKNPNTLPGMLPGLGAPNILMRGLTLGQSHQITPQDIGQDVWVFRDDLSYSFSKGGRHDVKAGMEYLYDFTFETVCNQCMGRLDLQGGPIPANIESLIPDPLDVSTWNLAALSPIARFYERAIGGTFDGHSGFTEYGPRHVYATWLQDDWKVGKRLTFNLGLRYDLTRGEFVNWVSYPPFIEAGRPADKNNLGPRVGFAYSLNERTVLRGGFGKYFADVSGQPTIFTLRNTQQITPQILNDGRPDFASNPFNGPAPTYEQAKQLLCSVTPGPTCLRPSFTNFVAPDLQTPYSYQASTGVQRQLGETISVQADYVYTGERATLNGRNINLSFDAATGANYRFTDISKRPYPDWGNTTMLRADGKSNYQSLQVALNKRMSNHWQASAAYALAGLWNFDVVPLRPGCNNPTTINAAGQAVCDVPVTLVPDISENKYYLAGEQRHRMTFNGIWDVGRGFQLSGLYLFGDNGKATPSSGVDVRGIGNSGGRLRANGTLIERNSFDLPSMHRVDMRFQQRLKLGARAAIEGILEVYNLFDRANYESFVTNESNALYGRPNASTNLAYAPRTLQLGFRATF